MHRGEDDDEEEGNGEGGYDGGDTHSVSSAGGSETSDAGSAASGKGGMDWDGVNFKPSTLNSKP